MSNKIVDNKTIHTLQTKLPEVFGTPHPGDELSSGAVLGSAGHEVGPGAGEAERAQTGEAAEGGIFRVQAGVPRVEGKFNRKTFVQIMKGSSTILFFYFGRWIRCRKL